MYNKALQNSTKLRSLTFFENLAQFKREQILYKMIYCPLSQL